MWALSGGLRSGGRPLNPELESMYIPLRFAEGWDPAKSNLGEPIATAQLAALERPLALRGGAGTGKTTWMRYTFRRCLAQDSGLLPIAVELRKLAFNWRDQPGTSSGQSFDTYLKEWAESYGCDGRALLAYIRDWREGLPRPLLLIDGWDELGELGRDFRERLLGFKNAYPHLLVVVTSRPYGTEPPSGADGYSVFDVQPLSDTEVKLLAERFHGECYGDDEVVATAQTAQFIAALGASADATVLARSPLQLTMMLLLHRTSPLPDRRHRLYDACLRSFLSARIDRAEREGVQRQADQWRPDDTLERWRTAEQLAHGVQAGEAPPQQGGDERMVAVLASEGDLLRHLPDGWDRHHKVGYVHWLAGPAAVLHERADSTLQFAHLSYQEFLAASYMKSRLEGEERMRVVTERAKDVRWWETLRLWAGLTQDESPDKLAPILERLLEDPEGRELVGLILADGSGDEVIMAAWAERHSSAVAKAWSLRTDRTLAAWSASGQEPRKAVLARALEVDAINATWLAHLRLERWNLAGKQLSPPTNSMARTFLSAQKTTPASPEAVALGRVWTHAVPTWPETVADVSSLQVWPTQRRLAGLRIQLAASLGAELSDELLRWALKDRPQTPIDLLDQFLRSEAINTVRGLRFGGRNRGKEREWALRELIANVQDVTDDPADLSIFVYTALGSALPSLRRLEFWKMQATQLQEEEHLQGMKPIVTLIDSFSNAAWPRTHFATWQRPAEKKEVALISLACRAYLEDDGQSLTALASAIGDFESEPGADPLWSALARHVTRQSTPQDRELLENLARDPEARHSPLSWGLRFIVRGDIWLPDGTFTTLDKLAERVGLAPLPLLEDSPLLPVLPAMPSVADRPE